MHNKNDGYSELLERYCHVINSNTTVRRIVEADGVKYQCTGCSKKGTKECDGGCTSKGCFEPGIGKM